MDMDTNWCPVCDKAIHPSLESLYCSQECLQYDALQRNPLLGYDFGDFKEFLRPSPSRLQHMHPQPRTPLSLVVAPSAPQQSPSAPLSPSSSSIYSSDSTAESPLVLTPRSQPPILAGSPPKLDLGLPYCNYHNHHQQSQPPISSRAAGMS